MNFVLEVGHKSVHTTQDVYSITYSLTKVKTAKVRIC